jgi:hypothetical protein
VDERDMEERQNGDLFLTYLVLNNYFSWEIKSSSVSKCVSLSELLMVPTRIVIDCCVGS